jgi:DNA-directed RNA polymerase subunit RPC12/RpoP
VKKSSRSPPKDSLNAIDEEDDDGQTVYSIRTEAPTGGPVQKPVQSHASSKVRIHETPTEVNEYESEEPHEMDSELEMRKMHANLIADARKKFPTRESLEDAIRQRQQQVEAAVNSGFSVDKQTLARAALADDEVRKLLPLRLILPSIHDLSEMVGVLQVHKENALRNSNLKKAMRLQGEIDDLESQLDLEKKYVLKRKIEMATAASKCISCGEPFTPETKMIGILKTKEYKCPNCRGQGLIASLIGGSPKAANIEKKEEEPAEKGEQKEGTDPTTESAEVKPEEEKKGRDNC